MRVMQSKFSKINLKKFKQGGAPGVPALDPPLDMVNIAVDLWHLPMTFNRPLTLPLM